MICIDSLAFVNNQTIHIINQNGEKREIATSETILELVWLNDEVLVYTTKLNQFQNTKSLKNLLNDSNIKSLHIQDFSSNKVLLILSTRSLHKFLLYDEQV